MRRSEQRRAALVALYQGEITGEQPGGLLPREAPDYSRELVEGVDAERETVDRLIERHATGWTLDRIAPLERSIMRVALYEMLFETEVPAEVAINEAVEAAKELCGAETPAFVNGVLGGVQREEAPTS